MTPGQAGPARLRKDCANCNVAAVPRPDAASGRMVLRPAGGAHPGHFLFLPDDLDVALPPLVCVHGISRNAEEHARAFAPVAARQRRLLVAPHFDAARFDGFQRVSSGIEEAVEALWRDVGAFTGCRLGPVDLVGFSGGAQFAHRYALLNPQRVRSQALVSAGWYTFPSGRDAFPYGVRSAGRRGRRCADNLARFLAVPTLVLVGAEDSQRDAALRRTPDIDIKQGINRIERASRWSAAFLQAATRAGVATTLQFATLPGCGHDFDDCVAKGGLVERIGHWVQRG
jgi:pimeloyl-ACP methyl ester carboxylesterase